MTELASSRYEVRTRRNVLDADATLIICDGPLSGGTGATLDVAIAHRKPYLVLHLGNTSEDGAIEEIRAWLEQERPSILNVAGPRESKVPGIYDRAYRLLRRLFGTKESA